MTESRVLLSVRNVGVDFKFRKSLFRQGIFNALEDISFDLYQGDSLGIIGKNGAGKTTLLRLLGGIIKPDKGKITNFNATTSMLSLQVGFDPELSGRVNAILSGMLLGFRKKDVKRNMDKIIAFSELEEFIDKPVKTYSAGMKARLGFSVALEMNPKIILIDEVLGVGDIEFRQKSVAAMREKLLSDQTIVFVSHAGEIVKRLCNRAVWIEEGVVRMDGPSDVVVDTYESYMRERGLGSKKITC